MARNGRPWQWPIKHRQSLAEDCDGIFRASYDFDGYGQAEDFGQGAKSDRAIDYQKCWQPGIAGEPSLERDFAANARRLAHGHHEWPITRRCLDHNRISSEAFLRRSRSCWRAMADRR